jgi:hypothetical protein
MSERIRLAVLAIALGMFAACDPSNPCDPGYYADHGACYLSDAGTPDGSADDAGSDAVDAQADRYAGFGNACTQSSQCPESAPTCGAPMFAVCTVVNCLDKPAGACPPNWTCLDVKTLSPDPTIKSVCVNF